MITHSRKGLWTPKKGEKNPRRPVQLFRMGLAAILQIQQQSSVYPMPPFFG
jgi:hypothetical protein